MAQQTKTITSESLESNYRGLTPSQDGFTEDLMASNVIIPVLDLTPSATGSDIPEYLQTALAFGSQTSSTVTNTTSNLVTTAGAWRIFGNFSGNHDDSAAQICQIRTTDGVTNKILLDFGFASTQADNTSNNNVFDFVYFAATGESLVAQSNSSILTLYVSVRQLTDVNGNFVYPSGFTPQ
jgi:hypothetical protein